MLLALGEPDGAIQFGSDSVGKFTQEIGSGWLESSGRSGGPEKGKPPVGAIADSIGLKTAWVPGSTQNMSNYKHVYTSDGKEGDADGSIRRAANAAYACIGKAASKGKGDPTVREALKTCGWEPKTSVEIAVDWALTVDDPGMIAKEQSLMLTLPDSVYEWWGPDDRFIVDQRPRGSSHDRTTAAWRRIDASRRECRHRYASVIDAMVKDTVPPGDKRVLLNTKVTKLEYGTNGVTAHTADGAAITGKVAISTIPLGVLNRQVCLQHRTA